jgi:hypothetical protein
MILSPQQKKQQKLIIVFVVVILITIIVLYFGLREPEGPVTGSGQELEPAITERPIEEIALDMSLFEDPQYQALKLYGAWPVEVEEVGRENPFVPY